MKKILITGASGLLGSKLINELLSEGYYVIATYNRNIINLEHKNLKKVRVDITNSVMIKDLILKTMPDTIVHAAAYTDVDGCETNKQLAWKVNVEGTKYVTEVARVVKSHLIYISTDYVFDGEKGLYKENDLPNPVNYYGLTKLLAEAIVRSSGIIYTIIRPSAIYGLGGSKRSFAEFVIRRLLEGKEVFALTDQFVSPILNTYLAKALKEVIKMRPIGILHIAGPRINRYNFARKLAEIFGLPIDLIKPIDSSKMAKWVAKRPRDSSLDINRAKSLLSFKFDDLDNAFRELKKEWDAMIS